MPLIKKIKGFCNSSSWNIGFVETPLGDILKNTHLDIHWLQHDYHDRWFADPFLLDVTDDTIICLVEEFCYKVGRGRIAKLTIRRSDYWLIDLKIILSRPTHLSFPFVYRKGGKIFLMPENGQGDTTKLYSYQPETDAIEPVSVVSERPLADAIIASTPDGHEWVLSTQIPTHNGRKLQVYAFNSKTMTMSADPVQELIFKSNIARNAGALFSFEGNLYRPAQDCNRNYGNGIVIQQVEYHKGLFHMCDVVTFHSDTPCMDLGYHTFNRLNGLSVIDGHGHNHPWAHHFYRSIAKLVHQ